MFSSGYVLPPILTWEDRFLPMIGFSLPNLPDMQFILPSNYVSVAAAMGVGLVLKRSKKIQIHRQEKNVYTIIHQEIACSFVRFRLGEYV